MTTGQPLEERYFSWLYSKVRATRDGTPGMSYMQVCTIMHRVKFDWHIPNDDNRADDGRQLRREFLENVEYRNPEVEDKEWLELDASIFEVLVALCLRANFLINVNVEEFFEVFLINLDLTSCYDAVMNERKKAQASHIIKIFNDRQYNSDGKGGIFPVKNSSKDQREVELWYQMAAYMRENEMY